MTTTTEVARIDRLARMAVHTAGSLGPPPPLRVLAPLRRDAVREILAGYRQAADEITSRIESGDTGARDQLADLSERSLAELRATVDANARGLVARLVARGDSRWRDCDSVELMDDPELDQTLRTGIISDLDDFNVLIDSYERFFDTLLPLMRGDGTTRVLDLAAGHGGFCLAAARIAAQRGIDIEFTASDLKREYLELGEEIARADGLGVRFVQQNALDLSNPAAGSYDIIVCTQSLHHFPPGLVTVMFDAAARAASRGVVFIDGCRSVLSGVYAAAWGTLRLRNPAWAHDAWISLRKCFVPEELELLARIARADGELESIWMPPSHCLLRWRREP